MNHFGTFFASIKPLEKVVGELVITQFRTNKDYIINLVDKTIVGGGEQLKTAIDKGFNTSHNTILALVLKPLVSALDNFITAEEASAQAGVSALYDRMLALLEAEVTKLTA